MKSSVRWGAVTGGVYINGSDEEYERNIKKSNYEHWVVDTPVSERPFCSIRPLPEYTIDVPREEEHGDFTTNVALVLARSQRVAQGISFSYW